MPTCVPIPFVKVLSVFINMLGSTEYFFLFSNVKMFLKINNSSFIEAPSYGEIKKITDTICRFQKFSKYAIHIHVGVTLVIVYFNVLKIPENTTFSNSLFQINSFCMFFCDGS